MSTRTNIVIRSGLSTIYIYRHCDGYLAETGADILQKLREAIGPADAHRSTDGAANHFTRAIFAEQYEQQSYEKAPRPVYELTTELHGDIEHAYFIEFRDRFNTGPVSIRHAARPENWHKEGAEADDWATAGKRYSLESFKDAVNADREACNQRIRELKLTSKAYADYTEYAAL